LGNEMHAIVKDVASKGYISELDNSLWDAKTEK
jgi:hypothetical protein